MTTAAEIVRCIKADLGDLSAGAAYCERIAVNAARNPWADPADAAHYREAAAQLRSELETRNQKLQT